MADPVNRDAGIRRTSDPWLALLLLEGLEFVTKGIRRQLGLKQGCRCPRCGHRS